MLKKGMRSRWMVLQGLLERLAVDPSGPNWLMTGSSRGHLTLWDMRFQLAVNSTQMAQVLSVLPVLASGVVQHIRLPVH